jgi:hypothetical protein
LARDAIEAHLTIVFAALAVGRWIDHQTGWSIRKFVKPPAATAPSRSRPGSTSSRPSARYPGDLRQALEAINHASRPTH